MQRKSHKNFCPASFHCQKSNLSTVHFALEALENSAWMYSTYIWAVYGTIGKIADRFRNKFYCNRRLINRLQRFLEGFLKLVKCFRKVAVKTLHLIFLLTGHTNTCIELDSTNYFIGNKKILISLPKVSQDQGHRPPHGLIDYIDTKAKCHLKKLTCKGTLRHVFIRVYRLEIQSVMLVFWPTHLSEL